MPKHPQYGMKGSKPRLAGGGTEEPPLEPNGDQESRAEAARKRFEINQKLDREYKECRNRKLKLELAHKEMQIAVERDQLILKELAIKQLTYLLIPMRQQILSIPFKVGNRFRSRPDIRELVDFITCTCHETLRTLADLPNCIEPDWEKRLEEWEEEQARPAPKQKGSPHPKLGLIRTKSRESHQTP